MAKRKEIIASLSGERCSEVKEHFDVIVVGGGPSGFIAAIASARMGASTLLIEKYGFLGGTPIAASLGPISPFHYKDEQVIAGIPQEFIDRMVDAEGSTGHMKSTNQYGNGSYLCFYDREVYKWIALQMILEAGVTILFHAFFLDAIIENDRVVGIVIANKSGCQSYTASVVIDATGDGDVAANAGVEYVIGRLSDGALQPITLMFEMANVDAKCLKKYIDNNMDDFLGISEFVALREFSPRIQHEYFSAMGFQHLINARIETSSELGQSYLDLLTTVHPNVICFNSTRVIDVIGTKSESLTRGEIDARRQVMFLSWFLINHVPGFKSAYLSNTGTQIGVRETRHIIGEYLLTGEDVISGRKFDDVIARGYFPIDVHDVKGRAPYTENGGLWADLSDSYDIPYRCLIPKNLDGLILSGRSISATHEAHGSFRTQGSVMALGQAAGTAAGISADHSICPKDVPRKLLQEKLIENGASLFRDSQKALQQRRKAVEAVRKALKEGYITGLHLSE